MVVSVWFVQGLKRGCFCLVCTRAEARCGLKSHNGYNSQAVATAVNATARIITVTRFKDAEIRFVKRGTDGM